MPNSADERTRALSVSELRERPSVTVNEAAKVLSLGRASAYIAAKNGQIPTVRVGHRLIVPSAALLRMLDVDQPAAESA